MPVIPNIIEPRVLGGPGAINVGGVKLFAVQLVFLVVGWVFVLLRGYVRLFMMKKAYFDDYIMLFAIIMYTPYAVIVLHSIVYGGTGAHTDQFTLDGAMISLRAWYLCEVMYSPISAAIRTSIGLLLMRIANEQIHKRIIWGNLIVIWLACFAYFFVTLFQCLPVDHFWMQLTGQPGYCMHPSMMANASIAFSVVAAVSDWVLGLLPIFILWNVQLNVRTKATISVLLGMGLCAGIALLVRIPLIKELEISTDFLYQTIDMAIWTVLEPSLGIIAGCASTLRPLFEHWGFDRLSSKPSRTGGSAPSEGRSIKVQKSYRQSTHKAMDSDSMDLPTGNSVHVARVPSSQDSTAEFELKESPATSRSSIGTPGMEKWDTEAMGRDSETSKSSEPVLPIQNMV